MKKRLSYLLLTSLVLSSVSGLSIYADTGTDTSISTQNVAPNFENEVRIIGKVTSINGNNITLEQINLTGEDETSKIISITLNEDTVITSGRFKGFVRGINPSELSEDELASRLENTERPGVPVPRQELSDEELAEIPELSDEELASRPEKPERPGAPIPIQELSDEELAEIPELSEDELASRLENPRRTGAPVPRQELSDEELAEIPEQQQLSSSDITINSIIEVIYSEDGSTVKEIRIENLNNKIENLNDTINIEEEISEESTENTTSENEVSEESIENTTSENEISEESIENATSENEISEESIENATSENEISEDNVEE